MKKAGVLHASRAAVDCVAEYYAANAPEVEFTHLLDDGVMRMLRAQDWGRAGARLLDMAREAQRLYDVERIVLTCSAFPPLELGSLKQSSPVPLFKMDEPMAYAAVCQYKRIGVLSTFPSTQLTTRELLLDAANTTGTNVQLDERLDAEALQALLKGDRETHDLRFREACAAFAGTGAEVLLLAQVSMARLKEDAERLSGVPVLESLSTSLQALVGPSPWSPAAATPARMPARRNPN